MSRAFLRTLNGKTMTRICASPRGAACAAAAPIAVPSTPPRRLQQTIANEQTLTCAVPIDDAIVFADRFERRRPRGDQRQSPLATNAAQ
jgi:hypothetical protein